MGFRINFICLAFVSLFSAQHLKAQLPYFNDFDSFKKEVVFLTSGNGTDSLPQWSVNIEDSGRVRVSEMGYTGFRSNALILDSRQTTQRGYSEAILSLNARAYRSIDLFLQLDMSTRVRSSDNRNALWLRADTSYNWIKWLDRNTISFPFNLNYKLDLDSFFGANNQDSLDLLQLRIGHFGSFNYIRQGFIEGVAIDNVYLVQELDRNAAVSKMMPSCSGKVPLRIEVRNLSLNQILNGSGSCFIGNDTFRFEINDTIYPLSSRVIQIDSVYLPSTQKEVGFLIDSINGQPDQMVDDTSYFKPNWALSGNYTVGGSNPDFSGLQEAFDAIIENGMCSDVNLILAADSFRGPFVLKELEGDYENFPYRLTISGQDSSSTVLYNRSFSHTLEIQLRESFEIKFNKLSIRGWGRGLVVMGAETILEESSFAGRQWQGAFIQGPLFAERCSFWATNTNALEIRGNIQTDDHIVRNSEFTGSLGVNFSRNCVLEGNTIRHFNFGRAISVNNSVDVDLIGNHIISHNPAVSLIALQNGTMNIANNYIHCVTGEALSATGQDVSIFHNTLVGSPALTLRDDIVARIENNLLYADSAMALQLISYNGAPYPPLVELNWNWLYSADGKMMIYRQFESGRVVSAYYNSLDSLHEVAGIAPANWIGARPHFASGKLEELHPDSTAFLGSPLGLSYDIDSNQRCGESPIIGAWESGKPVLSSHQISLPDSVFKGQTITIRSVSDPQTYQFHRWTIDGKETGDNSQSIELNVGNRDSFLLGLWTGNCLDSTYQSRRVEIHTPSSKPTPKFEANRTTVIEGELVELTDLSVSGITKRHWELELIGHSDTTRTYSFVNGRSDSSKQTQISFSKSGDYTVKLVVENALGVDSISKTAYIKVLQQYSLCSADDVNNSESGMLSDPSGPGRSYPRFSRFDCDYTLDLCADQIALVFRDFELEEPFDRLQIWEGTDSSGNPIHNYHSRYEDGLTGDVKSPDFKDTLFINSGTVYMHFTTNNRVRRNGFDIEWFVTKAFTGGAPEADFEIEDSICTEVNFVAENKSEGNGLKYRWEINSPLTSPVYYYSENMSHFFFFPGTFEIELYTESCGGTDSLTKTIEVVEPSNAPDARFNISDSSVSVSDTVRLMDESGIGGVRCAQFIEWKISPEDYVITEGRLDFPSLSLSFSDTGCYDIQLISSNSLGEDSLLSQCAVWVSPMVGSNPVHLPSFELYPNPSHGQAFIHIPNNEKAASLRIMDLARRCCFEERYISSGNIALNLNSLQPGPYVVELEFEDGRKLRKKLVIQ